MDDVGDVKSLMKRDLKNAAGKENVKFVAAKNWKIGTKRMNLFIVTDTPALFETMIKKAGAPLASGIASVSVAQGKAKVVIKKVTGAMDGDAVSDMLGLAVGDTTIVTSGPQK